MAQVVSVCISEKKGTKKHPVAEISLRPHHGIVGDAHAGDWHRQVSLLANESVDRMRKEGLTLAAGDFAENILTEGSPCGRCRSGPCCARARCGSRSRRSARSATMTARYAA